MIEGSVEYVSDSDEEVGIQFDSSRVLIICAGAFVGLFQQVARIARRGRKLFAHLNCAVCHMPKMNTGPSTSKALNRKTVALYSDLMVHDMGSALADICLEQAHPSDFRTEMLMGLRFRQQFLHDGSAKTVQEAIERHGGEARNSRDRFKALKENDKQALLKFLETI